MFGASQLLKRYTNAVHSGADALVSAFDDRTIWAACIFIASKLLLCMYEKPLAVDLAKNHNISAEDMVDAEIHILNTIKYDIGDLIISNDSAPDGN